MTPAQVMKEWSKLFSPEEMQAYKKTCVKSGEMDTDPAHHFRYLVELAKTRPELVKIDNLNCRVLFRFPDFDDEDRPVARWLSMRVSGEVLLTQEEAAIEAEVDYRTVQRWRKSGLKTIEVGGQLRITYQELREFVKREKGGRDIAALAPDVAAKLRRMAAELGIVA